MSAEQQESGQAQETETPSEPPMRDPRFDELREMDDEADHLDEVIEDARGAVHAAHDANSMRLPGDQESQDGLETHPPPAR
jgi:hypothetical protein